MYDERLSRFGHVLHAAYSKDSCYQPMSSVWSSLNRSVGQCAVSSFLVWEKFGGEVFSGREVRSGIKHYWNMIGGERLDFTEDQFGYEPHFSEIELRNPSSLLADAAFADRLNILRSRVLEIDHRWNRLREECARCRACQNVEYVEGPIEHFGKNFDILLVGEAPAPNGWRVSGKAFQSIDGKLIPSGKVLDDLLIEIGLRLDDLSFTEAAKCFPSNGRIRKANIAYCSSILKSQISLFRPLVVVPMGANAIRAVMNKDVSASQVVGCRFLFVEEANYCIIPIFHPSPANPMCRKGNREAFKVIATELERIRSRREESICEL
ncbi:YunG family protein [Gordonibacter massiliensis (ex Traore et al. 2017)]|uniref:Uracil-DNA glycosylase-like domain-containing protein n=1 Tax=Gordonibacter massiliensis (ex Traore et al. 2017) TaxID=1841863 RepID=A0A842JLD8_9ACTN|nr:uracil-DNA glycosylase family protein [Gordonibacter massiliensis (ex Traore et al. 2017)]MBC2889990.1 hypothetical protein [Gordonibacter massiliensis (ex Traore et al. 2017)]